MADENGPDVDNGPDDEGEHEINFDDLLGAVSDMIGVGGPTSRVTADLMQVQGLVRDTYTSSVFTDDAGNEHIFVSQDMEQGMRTETFPTLNPRLPVDIEAAEVVVDPRSMSNYVNRYWTPNTILFGYMEQSVHVEPGEQQPEPYIVARLDYHKQADDEGAPGTRNRNQHSCKLRCPYHIDYAKWRRMIGVKLTQEQLGNFVEDMMHTIADPNGADLIEQVFDIRQTRNQRFKSAMNQRDGTVKMEYVEDASDTVANEVTLTDHFTLSVPVFNGTLARPIEVKLRTRQENGQLHLVLAAPGLDAIEREEFTKIASEVSVETRAPLYYAS